MTRLEGVEERPTEFLFDVESYLAMDRAGLFDGRPRVCLLGGKIYEMAPISSGHGNGQLRAVRALDQLITRLGRGDELGPISATMIAGKQDAPEPDIMIVPLRSDDSLYVSADALLVCEIAWSSASVDLGQMRTLYAQAGIPEYWVLEAKSQRLHVFRAPDDGDYAEVQVMEPGNGISPLFADGRAEIAVADLF